MFFFLANRNKYDCALRKQVHRRVHILCTLQGEGAKIIFLIN